MSIWMMKKINFGTESEANTVLGKEGTAGCPQSHTKRSDVIVYCRGFPRSWGASDDVLLSATVEGCGMCRA